MTTIVGICGSLRRGSYNAMLLRAAVELAPEGTSVEAGSIRDIPLYDGDLEAQQGVPAAVQHLKYQIAAADGLLLVTPEYNNSIPGVIKNAIDWLSRPPADIPRVFRGRPVAILGDFNEWRPDDPSMRPFHARFGRWRLRTFPSRRPLFAIDRVMVDPPSLLIEARVHASPLARIASDHLPVRAEIDLPEDLDEARVD